MKMVPHGDESMLRHAERPVPLNPFIEIQQSIEERSAEVAREIEELREILSRPKDVPQRRRRDD